MDLVSVLILSSCVLLPYCGIMLVIAIVAYQTKLTSAIKYLKDYQAKQFGGQLDAKPSARLNIFIFVAITLLCLLGCVIVATIGYYVNLPWYPIK